MLHGSRMAASFLTSLTPQSTLAELPAWNTRLPASALGTEIDTALRRDPELPGVVVFDGDGVRGAISRAQFQQTISKPFGREVVGPRAVRFLLEELSPGAPMILDARTPVQEAVRLSLARDRSLLYEPILVGDGANVRLVGFTDLLQADSRISVLRNQQMQEILATVQEGFILVDRDHRIASEHSKSITAIFGRADLAGIRLPDLLGELAGSEHAELARGYLETLFNPNVIEKLVADINPLKSIQVPARDGRGRQYLRFAFRRSIEGKQIRRILVRVEDRTREVEMAAELEAQERQAAQRVDLAMEMMQIDPEALTDYLTRFLAEAAQIRRIRAKSNGGSARESADAIFRILHSLKGEAGVIGLRSFAEKLHRAEDVVQSLRDGSGPQPFAIERLDASIDALLAYGAEAKDLIARLSALASRRIAAPQPADLMTTIERLVADLSERLGKPARFVSQWNDADLPDSYRALVREALIQFTRNSLAHGLETEAQRRQSGKPLPAVVQVALRRHDSEGQVEIVFQDDGRGLDLDRIRLRAGQLFGLAYLDDAQVAQMIFEPGFSTAGETTADAGRGVGLDFVRERVERAGGMVLVHSEPGVFCAFQIVLPLQPER
jgi:two-component system chemotaxis sensor kinase CheA